MHFFPAKSSLFEHGKTTQKKPVLFAVVRLTDKYVERFYCEGLLELVASEQVKKWFYETVPSGLRENVQRKCKLGGLVKGFKT